MRRCRLAASPQLAAARLCLVAATAAAPEVGAQVAAPFAVPAHGEHAMAGMRPAPEAARGHETGAAPPASAPGPSGTEPPMSMGRAQGGPAPVDARDPNAYADGLPRSRAEGLAMMDTARFGRVLADKFEAGSPGGEHQRFDGFAWYGGDYHKVFLKADGDRENGRLGATRTEVLWDRVFATFWSTQLGLRHDFAGGPGRNWLAFGVQGLAPYWFDVEATLYVGEGGRTAFRAEANYDLLLTQRLILRPAIEAAFYGQADPERALGAGLSSLEAGLRLRYEIRRQFAPYIGVAWRQSYGGTAESARAAGEPTRRLQLVAGVRWWF